jgi:hypothetical protein
MPRTPVHRRAVHPDARCPSRDTPDFLPVSQRSSLSSHRVESAIPTCSVTYRALAEQSSAGRVGVRERARHPAEIGAPEVGAFLTALAVRDHVAASTQNQALSGSFLHAVLRRSPDQTAPPSSSSRVCPAAHRQGGRLLRDSPAGGRSRHPNGPGAAWPPRSEHHDDLHSRPQPRTGRRPQPGRPDVPVTTAVATAIGCDASRYIPKGDDRSHARVRVNTVLCPNRNPRAAAIYRTMQSDNAVQDRYSLN